jgi:hypothetical protein
VIYSHFSEMLKLGIEAIRYEQCCDEKLKKFLKKPTDSDEDKREFPFIEFLRKDLFKNKEHLNNLIKELIFYWNIASLRLDSIYWTQRYLKKKGYARPLSRYDWSSLGKHNDKHEGYSVP